MKLIGLIVKLFGFPSTVPITNTDCMCNETNLGLEEAQNDGLDEGGNAAIKVDEANAVAPAKDIHYLINFYDQCMIILLLKLI